LETLSADDLRAEFKPNQQEIEMKAILAGFVALLVVQAAAADEIFEMSANLNVVKCVSNPNDSNNSCAVRMPSRNTLKIVLKPLENSEALYGSEELTTVEDGMVFSGLVTVLKFPTSPQQAVHFVSFMTYSPNTGTTPSPMTSSASAMVENAPQLNMISLTGVAISMDNVSYSPFLDVGPANADLSFLHELKAKFN
jgi:hypothetical protein